MKLIAITPPTTQEREQEHVTAIVDAGFDYVHLRKPGSDADELRRWLDALPERAIGRIKLHSHFGLACEYPVAGIHLNSRCPQQPSRLPAGTKVSRSCHSIEELEACRNMEYAFLSPIFDSISKKGYTSPFNLKELKAQLATRSLNNVVALGGVTAENLAALKDAGFAGAAFLGYIFGSTDINGTIRKITATFSNIQLCYSSSPIPTIPVR